MASDRSIKQLAQRLIDLSLEDGELSDERVKEVLQAIAKMPSIRRKPLLKLYQSRIKRLIAASQAILETPVAISDDAGQALTQQITGLYNRKITLESRLDHSLIGGFRLRIGDDVYEKSIQSILQTFQPS